MVPPVTFSRGGTAEDGRVTAIEPTRAVDFAGELLDDGSRDGDLLQYLYRENVYVYDAMVAGWVVFSPVEFAVRDRSDGTTELIRGDPCPDELVRFDAEEATVHLDTLWEVRFPAGFEGLVVPPIASGTNPIEVVPRTVGGGQGETTLSIGLTAQGDGAIERGQAIVQIIPISRSGPEVGYRSATKHEMEEVQKEVRRQQIYPRVYSKERPSPRFGDLESIGNPEREE